MKFYQRKTILFFILCLLINSLTFAQTLAGAWQTTNSKGLTTTLIATDTYLCVSTYDMLNKIFSQTWGGRYTLSQTSELFVEVDFNSLNADVVNSMQSFNINLKKKSLEFDEKKLTKLDQKDGLTGLWKINARANPQGEMQPMVQGPRKTYKIMGGGHFQWIAMNTQTREFFGTGGGIYKLEANAYTETIHFFSRDNSRVGSSLTFEAGLNQGQWLHKGKSSKGEAIEELWVRQN
jgi:hypothetical protein